MTSLVLMKYKPSSPQVLALTISTPAAVQVHSCLADYDNRGNPEYPQPVANGPAGFINLTIFDFFV